MKKFTGDEHKTLKKWNKTKKDKPTKKKHETKQTHLIASEASLDHGILSSHLEILKFGEFIRDFDGVLLAGMIPLNTSLDTLEIITWQSDHGNYPIIQSFLFHRA